MISSYADVTGNRHLTSIGDAERSAPSPVSGCLQRNRRLLTWPAERDRNRIRSVCAEAIDQNGGKGVVLHSGLLRVDGMEPGRGTTA
jgi:hypothetical protein